MRYDSPISSTRPRKNYSRTRHSTHSRKHRSTRNSSASSRNASDLDNPYGYTHETNNDITADYNSVPGHTPLALPPPRFSDAADPDSLQHNTQSPPPPSVKDEEDDSSVEEIIRTTPPPDPSAPRQRPKSFLYNVLIPREQKTKERLAGRNQDDWFQSFLKGVASELDGREEEREGQERRSRRRH